MMIESTITLISYIFVAIFVFITILLGYTLLRILLKMFKELEGGK